METFLAWSLPVALASVLHEVAHALAARAMGDRMSDDRATLNPIAHVDFIATPLLSILVSLVAAGPLLFLVLKPVRFNPRVLHGARLTAFALAGPAANAVMLAAWAMVPYSEMQHAGVVVNAAFLVFNLLPIPPLDGWRALQGARA